MNHGSLPVILALDDEIQGSSDCDCACPSPTSLPDIEMRFPAAELQLPTDFKTIPLSDGYSVVFAPSLSRVAVLNQAALAVLERFRNPRVPQELSDAEAAAAQTCFRLGLLHQCNQEIVLPAANELVAWLHVTNACNLRCSYCYISKTSASMSPEVAQTAVTSVVQTAQRHGYQRVLLKYAGGEASLNLSLVEAVHRSAQIACANADISLRGTLLSNGVGLTVAKLSLIHELGLRLMISLDGLGSTHDTQRPRLGGQSTATEVLTSIEQARQLGIDLTISVTITEESVTGLPQVTQWLLDRKLHFTLGFYRKPAAHAADFTARYGEQQIIDGMRAAYSTIEAQLPRYSLLGCLIDRASLGMSHERACAAGENYIVIDHRGNIAKCQMEITTPVSSIWQSDPLQEIRLSPRGVQNLPVDKKEGCSSCMWRYWCGGGCAVATFRNTGRYDVRSPHCSIYQALFPEVVRLEGLRLLRDGVAC